MQQTNPDISSTRRRPPRPVLLILGLGALTGPLFLFAIAVDHLGWLASKIGISGTAVTNHLRWIVVLGMFGCTRPACRKSPRNSKAGCLWAER
jgi:hypothetical protein